MKGKLRLHGSNDATLLGHTSWSSYTSTDAIAATRPHLDCDTNEGEKALITVTNKWNSNVQGLLAHMQKGKKYQENKDKNQAERNYGNSQLKNSNKIKKVESNHNKQWLKCQTQGNVERMVFTMTSSEQNKKKILIHLSDQQTQFPMAVSRSMTLRQMVSVTIVYPQSLLVH